MKQRSPFLLFLVLLLLPPSGLHGSTVAIEEVVDASLRILEVPDPTGRYSHLLHLFLCLKNRHSSEISWESDKVNDIEVELFDPHGLPAPIPPTAMSVPSNPTRIFIPHGSQLDWLISHGGVSLVGDNSDHYTLIVGGKGWFIPLENAHLHKLQLRLKAVPWVTYSNVSDLHTTEVVLTLPPTPLPIPQSHASKEPQP